MTEGMSTAVTAWESAPEGRQSEADEPAAAPKRRTLAERIRKSPLWARIVGAVVAVLLLFGGGFATGLAVDLQGRMLVDQLGGSGGGFPGDGTPPQAPDGAQGGSGGMPGQPGQGSGSSDSGSGSSDSSGSSGSGASDSSSSDGSGDS